ncbi:hypothetical protein COB55_04080 [Candidatus Wolfebacteria bacterium]|nr:MAG: hypothetical protein COB55_04080 [Candidatus Wolfebacteria bacterium]
MKITKYTRNCPSCHKEMTYSGKSELKRAEKNNTICKLCNNKITVKNREQKYFKTIDDSLLTLIREGNINKKEIILYHCNKTKKVYAKNSNYKGYRLISGKILKNSTTGLVYRYNDLRITEKDIDIIINKKKNDSPGWVKISYDWTGDGLKNYIKKEYTNKKIPTFTELLTFDNETPEISIRRYYDRNGGKKEYYRIVDKIGGKIEDTIYLNMEYKLHHPEEKSFKSLPEFIIFCFFHHNKKKILYEPIKLYSGGKYCVPDFLSTDFNTMIRIKSIDERYETNYIKNYNKRDKKRLKIINTKKNRKIEKF